MALSRKYLQGMGLTEEQISAIIESNEETITDLKNKINQYKSDAEKLESVQKELDVAKEAMANGDKSPYKVKYEAILEEKEELQKEFDAYKTEVTEKETLAKKTDVYKALLKNAGVSEKRIDAIIRVTDVSAVELTADGKAKNADDLTNAIKSEWADFIATTSEQGVNTSTPPQNTGGADKVLTRAEIVKIKDTAERQQAWAKYLENERK